MSDRWLAVPQPQGDALASFGCSLLPGNMSRSATSPQGMLIHISAAMIIRHAEGVRAQARARLRRLLGWVASTVIIAASVLIQFLVRST